MKGYFFTSSLATVVQYALSGFGLKAYICVTKSCTTSFRIDTVRSFFCSSTDFALMQAMIVGLHSVGILKSWHNSDADVNDVLSSESMGAIEFLEAGSLEPNDGTGEGGEVLPIILLEAS